MEAIGMADDEHAVCSIYMMIFPTETLFFANCTVNIEPDAERPLPLLAPQRSG
jgi:phosphotransacetylase